MVNPINSNIAASSLLRAQSIGATSFKPNQTAATSIIEQLQKTSAVTAKSSTILAGTNNPSRNLPRGSLVDVLA